MMANGGITCLTSIVIIVSFVYRAAEVTSESVVISPKHVHFIENRFEEYAQVNITCKTTSPLSRCEFGVFILVNGSLTQYEKYEGVGLELTRGECVMTMKSRELVTIVHFYIVTCRVRSADNDWAYASMSVYRSYKSTIGLPRTAYDQVVLPGSQLNLAVRGDTILSACSISQRSLLDGGYNPLRSPWTFTFPTTRDSCNASKDFYGQGQNACMNTCGISYDNVTEAHNGIFFFSLESNYNRDLTFINVIVAKLPSTLTLNYEMAYNADGSVTLKATCTVSGGRPAPRVTWTLDGQMVPSEAVRSVAAEKWVWPDEEQTVQQTMTLALNESHAGKEVLCSAMHPTFNVTQAKKFKIRSDRSVKCFYVVIGVLSSLLVLLIIFDIIYARRKKLCCFLPSKENRDALPSVMTLNHEMADNADGSVTLEATCIVSGGRPAPSVTWILDGQLVPSEAVRSVATEKWEWPHEEQTVQQIMTLKINESHFGKKVSCAVKQPANDFTLYNTFKIRSGFAGSTVYSAIAPEPEPAPALKLPTRIK